MDALSTKRLATGALIFAATLLFLSATSEPTSTAVNLLVDDHDNSDAIMATGTRMQMTEYADNGQRLYSLRVAEWTQYRGAENTHIELLQPEMRLFDDSDTTPWQVSAQRGSAKKLGNQPRLTLSDQCNFDRPRHLRTLCTCAATISRWMPPMNQPLRAAMSFSTLAACALLHRS